MLLQSKPRRPPGRPRLVEPMTMTDVAPSPDVLQVRASQRAWAAQPVRDRQRVLRKIRNAIATHAEALAAAVPTNLPGVLHRSAADTLVAEVLPLLEAARYLEQNAAAILADRREPHFHAPFWLGRTTVTTRRVPLGVVLIIAAGNYPLFLSGVQMLQALIAGNAALVKPAPSTGSAVTLLREICCRAGVPSNVVQVLDDDTDAAVAAMRAGVDKVFFTGSDRTGVAILHELADSVTPCVLELSGCDAVFVLPTADLDRAVEAIAFAVRLNGSATCMAPRRVFVHRSLWTAFIPRLRDALQAILPAPVPPAIFSRLSAALDAAESAGARLLLDGRSNAPDGCLRVTLIDNAQPRMDITQQDIFAPVLSLFAFEDEQEAAAMDRACRYALTASIFGSPSAAARMAGHLDCGTILINDVIVSTADPRAAFGGRKRSGFGVTRGREGLLAMTAVQTLLTQSSRSRRAYQPVSGEHERFFYAWLRLSYGHGLRQRMSALRALSAAGRRIANR
jgi:acyl-CoA reductase-like NAD-dependent aldehyde dehydrogenase